MYVIEFLKAQRDEHFSSFTGCSKHTHTHTVGLAGWNFVWRMSTVIFTKCSSKVPLMSVKELKEAEEKSSSYCCQQGVRGGERAV